MRDDSYLKSESATILAARKWRNGVITAIGALSSVVIIVAVVTWSYRFTVRDAEDIPVIRAEAGLTKIKPEESGGQVVAHQERTVYDAVTKGGADAPAVETAKLAPPPATLAEEDKVPSKLAPAPQKRPEQAAATETKPDAPAPAEAGVDPLAAAVAAAVAEVVSEEGAEGVEGNAQAPKFAPAARSRPTRTDPVTARAETPEPRAAAAASEIQIQLGAFDSEAIAEQQWRGIKGRNGDLLTGRGRVITSVQSGGRTLWRLRAGPFDAISDASALCRGLQSRNVDCIVARTR